MSLPKLNLTLRQFWGLFLLFLFSFSLPLTVYLVSQKQDLLKRAEEVASVSCDGNNDQLKINAAINALPPTGGIVTLPARQCLLNGSININQDHVTLEGQGTASVLFLADNTNRDVIVATNKTNLHIRNLKIDGNKNQQTGESRGIFLVQAGRSSIENVAIQNISSSGIYLNYPGAANPEFLIDRVLILNAERIGLGIDGYAQDITVRNTTIDNSGAMGFLFNVAGRVARNIRIENNTITRPKGPGLTIDGSGSLDVIWIVGNTVSGMHDTNSAFGIWLPGLASRQARKYILNNQVLPNGPNVTGGDHFGLGGDDGELIGNTSEGSWADGFAFGNVGLEVRRWVIRNNRALNNGRGGDGQGFMLYRIKNSTISGNLASGNNVHPVHSDGIRISGGMDNVIENNEVQNNTNGIYLRIDGEATRSGSLWNMVRRNRVLNNGRGIVEEVGGDYNTFDCNEVTNQDITIRGPHSTVIPCPTPTPTPAPRPTNTPTPRPTPTPTSGIASLTFTIRFQGITQQRANKTVTLTLKQPGTNIIKYQFNNLSISSSANGVYTGRTPTSVLSGSYDLYIKGWVHLQKRFPNITLNPGNNTRDFTSFLLKAGDLVSNNQVNIYDYNRLLAEWRRFVAIFGPRIPVGSLADLDLDKDVDIFDYNLLVGNFNQGGDE